jgi:hypothetical protein
MGRRSKTIVTQVEAFGESVIQYGHNEGNVLVMCNAKMLAEDSEGNFPILSQLRTK